jgi:hypothetical protein
LKAPQLCNKPICVDLFCGLGGWASAFLAEGYYCVGFDIERHDYGSGGYPGQLVIQDVLTLHGSQFQNASVIVASPPCQAYSYRAMPWSRAKALPPPDNTLFEACFRIQREASEAAGRHIPLIVENVCGAQKWVGRAKWHFGSFYLWGDLPALMPIALKHQKVTNYVRQRNGADHTRHLTNQAEHGSKNNGRKIKESRSERRWENRPVKRLRDAGTKVSGDWFGSYEEMKTNGTISPGRLHGKGSPKRKAASAEIAKIPFPLAQHIARCFAPNP